MAYDEILTSRYRAALDGHVGITEKKMMGGVCFFLDGNMIGGGRRHKDGISRYMFRVGKDNEAEAMARDGAEVVEMGGRRMGGFIWVPEDAIQSDDILSEWVALTLSFTVTLPAKP